MRYTIRQARSDLRYASVALSNQPEPSEQEDSDSNKYQDPEQKEDLAQNFGISKKLDKEKEYRYDILVTREWKLKVRNLKKIKDGPKRIDFINKA